MSDNTRRILGVILLVMILALVLVSCSVDWQQELNRETGVKARQELDKFLDASGDFLTGFCGLPAAGAALAIGLVTARRDHRKR